MVTFYLNYVGREKVGPPKGASPTHDCASMLDSIAKGISLFP